MAAATVGSFLGTRARLVGARVESAKLCMDTNGVHAQFGGFAQPLRPPSPRCDTNLSSRLRLAGTAGGTRTFARSCRIFRFRYPLRSAPLNMLAKFSDPPAIPPARALLHFCISHCQVTSLGYVPGPLLGLLARLIGTRLRPTGGYISRYVTAVTGCD